MNLIYKRATIENLEILTKTRIEVLRSANRLDLSVDMSIIEKETRNYYKKSLCDDTHIAYLVVDNDNFIGAGGVSFYTVMPTYHNPSGKKAYIMNMYTNPNYRRKGIAYHTLDLLVQECKSRGVNCITLEATDMGKPLYQKYGFVQLNNEMELPNN